MKKCVALQKIAILLIALVLATLPMDSYAVCRALVVGLGRQQDPAWSVVHGDKDAEAVVKMLRGLGWKDVAMLTNEQATKQGIANAFLKLEKKCIPDDVIYIHYSGHGQLMTDLDGDEAKRWTGRHSGYDESWIPYDAYMTYGEKDHGEKHFCDDEIAFYLTRIRRRIGKKGRLVVVIDACHSGDATRGADDECIRGVDTEFIIPRPLFVPVSKHTAEDWLTVSACRPYQLCFELKSPPMGKLTAALCLLKARLFTMKPSCLQTTLDDFMAAHPSRLPQNPVVSGHW